MVEELILRNVFIVNNELMMFFVERELVDGELLVEFFGMFFNLFFGSFDSIVFISELDEVVNSGIEDGRLFILRCFWWVRYLDGV